MMKFRTACPDCQKKKNVIKYLFQGHNKMTSVLVVFESDQQKKC